MTKRSWQYFMWMGKGAAWLYSTAHAAAKEAELKRLAEEAARPPDPMDGLADAGELDQYRYQPGLRKRRKEPARAFGRLSSDSAWRSWTRSDW